MQWLFNVRSKSADFKNRTKVQPDIIDKTPVEKIKQI